MRSFSRIVTNAGWNFLGSGLPLLAAVVAIPYLVDRLGLERFGLLGLIWIFIGYFSFLDLGLGRALTKFVAEQRDRDREGALERLCATGLALAGLLGLAGALLVLLSTPLVSAFDRPESPAVRQELLYAIALVAVAVPIVVATSGLRGILEGFQRFRLLALIRVPAGVLLFAAPCVSASQTDSLAWATAAIVVTRVLILGAHLLPVLNSIRLRPGLVDRNWAGKMLTFGGWVTVSNSVGPVIVYADRFFIGSLISPAALAFYSAPSEIVSRLLILPTALTTALFPALAAAGSGGGEAKSLRRRAGLLIAATAVPLAMFGVLFADVLLEFWLGRDFAANATGVTQILLVGFCFNALAQVPFSALQSDGAAKLPALLHLVELPVYLVALVGLVGVFGLEGAALAWTVRAFADYVLLSVLLYVHEKQNLVRRPWVGDR